MLLAQLANFLLYNLLQSRINFIIVFHCWPPNESWPFAQQMRAQQLIYIQFVALDDIEDWSNLEYRFLRHLQPTLAVYMDMSCDQGKAALKQSSQEQIFTQHYHWLLHDVAEAGTFYDYFADFNISVDADVTYVQEESANQSVSYTLYDVYNNGKHIGGKLNMTAEQLVVCNGTDGECYTEQYLSGLHLRAKYANRATLTDVNFRVSTVVTKRPLTLPTDELVAFLSTFNETHEDGLARFGFHQLIVLRDLLQLNLQYMFTDAWSRSDTSGGIMGHLINQEVEIGSAPTMMVEPRLRYISAIMETGFIRSVCMFRTPHSAGIRGDVFLQPFSAQVWYLFAGTLLLTAIMLWITFYLERHRLRFAQDFAPSLLSSVLIALGEACMQSSSMIPRSAGGRVAYIALFMICFIMYNYYTSIVVSSLLSSPVKSSVTTLEQLAQSSLDVGIEPLIFTQAYLNTSRRTDVQLFRQRKVETQTNNPQLWLSAKEGILRVRDEPGYVFLFEASSGYAYVQRFYTPQQICDLNEILFRPEQILYTHVHRNSTYKELLRLKSLRIAETGIYRKHRNYWVITKLDCYNEDVVVDVGMEYVAPLFFLLLCGYFLVALLLLLEFGWHRYVQRTA